MFAALRDRPQVADQFAAHLMWMSVENLFPGRSYLMKINNGTLPATVTELKHQIDVTTLSKLAAKTLALNEVGVCKLSVAWPIVFDAYADNHDTGAFILIDRYSNKTVAAGMIDFALRRATNIHYHDHLVSKTGRMNLMRHRPAVLWFTGLPGSGKSTIANLVEAALHARGAHTVILDGDNVRHGLNKDLGFTEPDRVENIRRTRPSTNASRAIPRACIGARSPARSRILPASTSPMRCRKTPNCIFWPEPRNLIG